MNKIMVICHDGEKYETTVDNYDATKIAADIADSSKTMIVIGDIIVHKTNISRIVKIQ